MTAEWPSHPFVNPIVGTPVACFLLDLSDRAIQVDTHIVQLDL